MLRKLMMSTDVCGICKQTRAWHEEVKPQHQFNAPASSLRVNVPGSPSPSQGRPEQSFTLDQARAAIRGDVVLRILLVELGIITSAQVEEVEGRVAHALITGHRIVEMNLADNPDRPSGTEDRGDWVAEESERGLWHHRALFGSSPSGVGDRADEPVSSTPDELRD